MLTDHTADVAIISRIATVPTILEVLCRTTGMGFAAVARVTKERWVACGVRDEIQFGLQPGGELRVETTICNEIQEHHDPIIIERVSTSAAFCGHPAPAMYGFESYISTPIILPDGSFFGTLCAVDPKPRRIDNPETIGMFTCFAELIAFHIDSQRKLTASTASLDDERRASQLREQFIAVLGHDLRNPLTSISFGMQIIAKDKLGARSTKVLGLISRSVDRMTSLIDDILDFARGRLGGGIPLELAGEVLLAPVLVQVIDELRGAHPDRRVIADLSDVGLVRCDPGRIGQLLSNLLANALVHGAQDGPVSVTAAVNEQTFELSVSNPGTPIPPEVLAGLFEPFVRAAARPNQKGLGLGLYIASQIAQAHGGRIDVTSTAAETRFTFRMPFT